MKRSKPNPAHYKSLGFANERDYFEWCSQHHFSRTTDKPYKQLQKESELRRSEKGQKVLQTSRFKEKNADQLLQEFVKKYKSNPKQMYVKHGLEGTKFSDIPTLITSVDIEAIPVFLKLVSHVSPHLDLSIVAHNQTTFFRALTYLTKYSQHFMRRIEDWKPKTHNIHRKFSSLLRHLLVKYQMPNFMDLVWFSFEDLYQEWYIHLGTGQNLRTAKKLPCALTKKQAHYFHEAPDDYPVLGAIRYAQVRTLGGSLRLTNALLPTRICTYVNTFSSEFWDSVIQWFVENPMLDLVHVAPIIDWLFYQRQQQPNLSMKKRDPVATLEQVARWHKQTTKKKNYVEWKPSGIAPLEFIEKHRTWKIVELLNSKELTAEGKAMSHCVGSYTDSCLKYRTSIWSMTVNDSVNSNRELTIQVDNQSRRISQMRGKYNDMPTEQQLRIVSRWCQTAGLNINKYY